MVARLASAGWGGIFCLTSLSEYRWLLHTRADFLPLNFFCLLPFMQLHVDEQRRDPQRSLRSAINLFLRIRSPPLISLGPAVC